MTPTPGGREGRVGQEPQTQAPGVGHLPSSYTKEAVRHRPRSPQKQCQGWDLSQRLPFVLGESLCWSDPFYCVELCRSCQKLQVNKSLIPGAEECQDEAASLPASALPATLGVKWLSSIIIIAECQGVNWRMVSPVQTSPLNEQSNRALSAL